MSEEEFIVKNDNNIVKASKKSNEERLDYLTSEVISRVEESIKYAESANELEVYAKIIMNLQKSLDKGEISNNDVMFSALLNRDV